MHWITAAKRQGLYGKYMDVVRCVDCGARRADDPHVWMTEHQCMDCWRVHGRPEARGKPSSEEAFKAFLATQPPIEQPKRPWWKR